MGRLFWKFFLSILLAQVAATVAIGGTIWLRDRAHRGSAPTLDAGPPAEVMTGAAAVTLRHGGIEALREMLGDLQRPALFVLDPNGKDILGRPVSDELRNHVDQMLASEGERHAVRAFTGPDGQRYIAFVPRGYEFGRPGREPQGRLGPPGGSLPFGHHIGRIAPIVAAVLASLLFAALLAWYFARPIRALRSAFEAAAAGDLAPRFAAASGAQRDELADLGRDFDRMSAQLRSLMDGQRRLLHDVSHELRSPLARLQAAIGLAHQQPEKVAASLERIERESMRMDRLVGELLTLSRLESSPKVPRTETIDVAEMIEQIADDARFEAGQTDAAILVDVVPGALVRGAPDLLWRAIENVVRNAIKHGGEAGVQIALRRDPHFVHIEVLDRGPGIDDADLPSIFQPFFRSNPQSNNVDGHGLGLAIAQRVVQAHEGKIMAANRSAGGLCVTISLPLAS
ncbi:sensor histidine kinase [Massilia horti]|uniref:histidine kinase n=1 Tax=Massilia horti TaxID=2562153 RepID=A0A4Y9T625_9BURK|nr:ATP-binding protein [Massilia horti]TFW32788.1 HAMP domain-containing protein [Massilia horti]